MVKDTNTTESAMKQLRWPLLLTRLGMFAERTLRVFWPLISVVFVALAGLMFGLHETVSLEITWAASVLVVLGAATALGFGVYRFRWPTVAQARARLDHSLPGQPLSAILDEQAIGANDPASKAVWNAHVARMAKRLTGAKAVIPDLQVARRDPYALRYVATLALIMAGLFGSVARVATIGEIADNPGENIYGAGPSWEGWIEPPAYTGKPSLYLADLGSDVLDVAQGSLITLRLYGDIGALTVAETVSGRKREIGSAADSDQHFEVAQSGTLEIDGPGGQKWKINSRADMAPTVAFVGAVERGVDGEMRTGFVARDDYGIQSGYGELTLDLGAVDRRFGLKADPEPREMITFDLPLPFRGDRRDVSQIFVENLALHPWAGLPVHAQLFVSDAAGQVGKTELTPITLPGRRFFDPLAASLVEQRRYLLWSKTNAPQVAQVLRAVSNRPDDIFASQTAYLKLRVAIRRLEFGYAYDLLSDERQAEISQALWDIAIAIEDGNLSDAKERLRQAQDRLEQAMRDGASDDEIAQLMDEMRDAMQDYLEQLAQNQDQNNSQTAQNQDTQEITSDQLQQMLDRLQELMEQGRMAEAQELMDQLRQMMENMQTAQNGDGQQSPGQQALDELSDTLRRQQGLSDETFGDLQDQFSQDGEQGDNGQQGQQGQGGQQGQSGTGGEQGQGQQQGAGQGQRHSQGQDLGQGLGGGRERGLGLADRQQALRNELNRQTQNLPGAGTPGDEGARDALGRAGRAMEGAEQALRQDDYAGALDSQAEALEALREGMRNLANELAQQQNQQTGQQGQAFGQANRESQQDPLGRQAGAAGQIGTDEQLLQGEDVYRRAQEILEEIRRRSSDQSRPDVELNYLQRLLDKF